MANKPKPILSNALTFLAGTGKKLGIDRDEKKLDKQMNKMKKRMGAK